MVFKIAVSAGHCMTTAGKRLPKKLDPKQTREWVLNDRIARYLEEAALQYADVAVLRLDNRNGSAGNTNAQRAKKATQWGADVLLDIHHNAGVNLGKGGGIVAFCRSFNDAADAVFVTNCLWFGGGQDHCRNYRQQKKKNCFHFAFWIFPM